VSGFFCFLRLYGNPQTLRPTESSPYLLLDHSRSLPPRGISRGGSQYPARDNQSALLDWRRSIPASVTLHMLSPVAFPRRPKSFSERYFFLNRQFTFTVLTPLAILPSVTVRQPPELPGHQIHFQEWLLLTGPAPGCWRRFPRSGADEFPSPPRFRWFPVHYGLGLVLFL